MARTVPRNVARLARAALGAGTGLRVTHVNTVPVTERLDLPTAMALVRSRWILTRLRAAGVHGTAEVKVTSHSAFTFDVEVDIYTPTRHHPGALSPVRVAGRSTWRGLPSGAFIGDVRIDVGARPVGDDDDEIVHLCEEWATARENLMWAVMAQIAAKVWAEVVAADEVGVRLPEAHDTHELVLAYVGCAGELAMRISAANDPEVGALALEHGGRVRIDDLPRMLGVDALDADLFEPFVANVAEAASASLGMDCGAVKEAV